MKGFTYIQLSRVAILARAIDVLKERSSATFHDKEDDRTKKKATSEPLGTWYLVAVREFTMELYANLNFM